MGLKAWLLSVGLVGLYYLFKHTECEIFTEASYTTNKSAADAWISQGATFTQTNDTTKAMVDLISDFNDFMDELSQDDLLRYFSATNPDTGLDYIPDFVIRFPNGLTLTIIESSKVVNFRLNEINDTWKGVCFKWLNTNAVIAFRLTEDPTFEFDIPGTSTWPYEDFDGVIRPGNQCTPPKAVTDTDLMYISNYYLFLDMLYKILKYTGLTGLVKSFINRIILRRPFNKIRDQLEDVSGSVLDNNNLASEILSQLSTVSGNYFSSDNLEESKLDKILKQTRGRRNY